MIVGLDVGSSKVAAVAADHNSDGSLTYLDGTFADAYGVRNGIIVDLNDAVASIESALFELEERCNRHISAVCLGVGGPHVTCFNARGGGQMLPAGREITHDDVARSITIAREALPPMDNRDIIHEIPRAYRVDGQPGIHDPHGMLGYELEVEVHYSLGVSTTIANLHKCVREAHVNPVMLVAAPLATGEVARTAYPHIPNIAVADIGAETTALAIYDDGAIWSSDVLAGGSADITKELASQLKIPIAAAEDVKLRYGHCDPAAFDEFELVDLPPSAKLEGTLLPRSEVARIIQERAYALADALIPRLEEARQAGREPELLVITGRGAELPGMDKLLMRATELPVERMARGVRSVPAWVERPEFATAAGLVLWYAHYTPSPGSAQMGKRRGLPRLMAQLRRITSVVLP